MNKGKNTAKGITLIALVITIIVMLILVGVTISMAINGGLFGYAKKAAKDTENQKQAEQELSSGKVTVNGKEYDSIDDYLNNRPQLKDYSEELLDETTKVLKENAKYVSDGKTAIIPKGFKIIADENGEKSINAGLVIQDETKNEYVWIPVDTGKLKRTNWNLETGEPTGTISSELTEALPGDLENSVTINKGFYIGRYEAGRSTETISSDTITEILTKKEKYPYFSVTYDDAANEVKKMYTDKTKYGVEATLQYGAMWDETLRFVKDETHSVTDSKSWGNYYDQVFTFSGKYYYTNWSEEVTNKNKWEDAGYNGAWLLTTGATERNKAKNIYDLAGNTAEWTNEKYSETSHSHVFRGGWYSPANARGIESDGYMASSATCRATNIETGHFISSAGFRVALYIK